MREMTDHSFKGQSKSMLDAIDAKLIACILDVELAMYLMAVFKDVGSKYLPVVLIMMLFTVVGSILVNSLHADKPLFVITLILLNLGFLIQQITSYQDNQISAFLKKFVIAIVVALVTGLIYSKIKNLLEKDFMVVFMMIVQIAIGFMMIVFGQFVGSSQGATISFRGMTPFEIVKLLYIFVCAGLLKNTNTNTIRILGKSFDRELVLLVHTGVLVLIFVCCSELGTMMIVYTTGLLMLWIFGKKQKWILLLMAVSFMGFSTIWYLSAKVFLPLISKGKISLPGALSKIVKRFGCATHPEMYMQNYGYQGTNGLQAISIGGWLGIPAERYRVELPEAMNDFIFANIVQTCGVIMGFLVLLFFFAFLRIGFQIAMKSKEAYLQRTACAITLVITIEALVHIGYNIAAFPITGIPLYFISQGFTAIITGMLLVAILLVISANQTRE